MHAHAPPHRAHSLACANRHTPPLFQPDCATKRAPTSTRSIGFCAIWVCISSSSSSSSEKLSIPRAMWMNGMDGRVGRSGAACVVPKTTTGTAENDQRGLIGRVRGKTPKGVAGWPKPVFRFERAIFRYFSLQIRHFPRKFLRDFPLTRFAFWLPKSGHFPPYFS